MSTFTIRPGFPGALQPRPNTRDVRVARPARIAKPAPAPRPTPAPAPARPRIRVLPREPARRAPAPAPQPAAPPTPRSWPTHLVAEGESNREIGALWFVEMHAPDEPCFYRWTNCDGQHLYCRLPDGHVWDIDSRASNCTMKDETTHRCWVRVGDPRRGERVHVDKNGHTCAAGGGSIQTGSWHGFLHHGELRL